MIKRKSLPWQWIYAQRPFSFDQFGEFAWLLALQLLDSTMDPEYGKTQVSLYFVGQIAVTYNHWKKKKKPIVERENVPSKTHLMLQLNSSLHHQLSKTLTIPEKDTAHTHPWLKGFYSECFVLFFYHLLIGVIELVQDVVSIRLRQTTIVS